MFPGLRKYNVHGKPSSSIYQTKSVSLFVLHFSHLYLSKNNNRDRYPTYACMEQYNICIEETRHPGIMKRPLDMCGYVFIIFIFFHIFRTIIWTSLRRRKCYEHQNLGGGGMHKQKIRSGRNDFFRT